MECAGIYQLLWIETLQVKINRNDSMIQWPQ